MYQLIFYINNCKPVKRSILICKIKCNLEFSSIQNALKESSKKYTLYQIFFFIYLQKKMLLIHKFPFFNNNTDASEGVSRLFQIYVVRKKENFRRKQDIINIHRENTFFE